MRTDADIVKHGTHLVAWLGCMIFGGHCWKFTGTEQSIGSPARTFRYCGCCGAKEEIE